MFSSEISEIFKNAFCTENLWWLLRNDLSCFFRVFPDAPRVGDPVKLEWPIQRIDRVHEIHTKDLRNGVYTRKRARTKEFYEHDDRGSRRDVPQMKRMRYSY